MPECTRGARTFYRNMNRLLSRLAVTCLALGGVALAAAFVPAIRPWGLLTPYLGAILLVGFAAGTIRKSPRR